MKSSDSMSPFSYQQLLGPQNGASRNDATMNFNDNSSMLGQFSPPTTPDSALQLRREANNARERIRVKKHRECFMDLKDVIGRHVSLGKDVSRLALLRSATELIKKLERDIISMSQAQNDSSRQGSMSDPPSPVSTGAMGMATSPGAPLRSAMPDFQAVGLPHPFAPALNNANPTQLFNPTLPNIPQVSAAHAMQYQHLPTLNDLQQNMVNHPFEYIM
ncbi:Oidioi.mRNA.OKI2018_I69.PAR.g11856.t1.cds [Oikopleura dioica]|uniref:Oidioi.mRNA.OKI2018_I69.PAR.g11856.t1.cds n=1 Tax=Oikopleura dioica TaxID=34765 RepID=A0ABN7RY89_OIKDI|nr:Oidioi.mRNA.OKI2018_I69.PAR.g11856.t1.cds [Oikopleura dioica]